MKNILVVEDSKSVLATLVQEFENYDDMTPITATTYEDMKNILSSHKGSIDFAILDLTLPDAHGDKTVSLALHHHIPSIVLTSSLNTELRDVVFGKKIVDYILKNGTKSFSYAVKRVHDYVKSYDRTILVVDDSVQDVMIITEILKDIDVKVLEASDGVEAMKIINDKNNKVSTVITDYKMPNMDGLELTMQIRANHNKDEFSIIVISSSDDDDTIEKFVKVGVNDFISKPLNANKMLIQVRSSLELLELFSFTRDLANKDFLTGAFNRRYFFDAGSLIFNKSKRKKENLAVAMLDIDKFKRINDTYGHHIGDVAIQEMQRILKEMLRVADLFARFGGEEFCLLLDNISIDDTKILFEKIRLAFEKNIITVDDVTLSYTVSIGVIYGMGKDVYELVNKSDEALYEAKESGRNRVIIYTL